MSHVKIATALVAATVALSLATSLGTASGRRAARAARSPNTNACYNDTTPRDQLNPLDSATHTGRNPLSGANLYVEGPGLNAGIAADAIATEIGQGWRATQTGHITPWPGFKRMVERMRLRRGTAFRIHELEKIANYPESHQMSMYTAGGSGSAITTQLGFYLCRVHRDNPAAAAIVTTYFLRHHGVCLSGDHPRFAEEVRGLKRAIGGFPTVVFIEEDAVTTLCGNASQMAARARLLKYEVDQLAQLPHVLLYLEGGTVDAKTPGVVAWMLNHSDARLTRGFFLNDTHFNWGYREIAFANQISRMTGGLHFVVDTRASGQGPLKTADPVHEGNEELCNPPHRGLGPRPGASDGRRYGMYSKALDGFMWVTIPGTSGNTSCPGRPNRYAPAGAFDPNLAIDYAVHANDRVGPSPRFPSRPYAN